MFKFNTEFTELAPDPGDDVHTLPSIIPIYGTANLLALNFEIVCKHVQNSSHGIYVHALNQFASNSIVAANIF